jgi:hypothetical protein
MAFTTMISELYDAFRRKVGGDEEAAKAPGIADKRFHIIDGGIAPLDVEIGEAALLALSR